MYVHIHIQCDTYLLLQVQELIIHKDPSLLDNFMDVSCTHFIPHVVMVLFRK